VSSDTGPVKPISGMWQNAQASLRFTESLLVIEHRLYQAAHSVAPRYLAVRPLRSKFLPRCIDLCLDFRNFLQSSERKRSLACCPQTAALPTVVTMAMAAAAIRAFMRRNPVSRTSLVPFLTRPQPP